MGGITFKTRHTKKLFSAVSLELKYNALEEIAKTVVDLAWGYINKIIIQ